MKKFIPIYIGFEEAETMKAENLFTKEGDTLTDFFGNNVIISGILPQTKTDFDKYHIVFEDFQLKQTN